MRTLCEVSWEKNTELKDGESAIETDVYVLLHWGLKMEIINDVGVSYTVAICSHLKTGEVLCFLPEQLKILGTDLKK
jgi:hydrogenase maturation factor